MQGVVGLLVTTSLQIYHFYIQTTEPLTRRQKFQSELFRQLLSAELFLFYTYCYIHGNIFGPKT